MVTTLLNTITSMQSAGQIRQSLALAYWPRVVGALAARSSAAIDVRNRVLFIRTKSSAWSHELSMQKSELIRSLNRLLDGNVIEEIKFRTDGAAWIEPVTDTDSEYPDDLEAVLLTPDELNELQSSIRSLNGEDRVKRAIATAITREAKLRHWRLENGWKLCVVCLASHKSEGQLCPVCRLIP